MRRYEELVEKCKKLGSNPPPQKAYMKSYGVVKDFIDVLIDAAGKSARLNTHA